MIKRIVLAIVAVFIAWQATDFLIHGILLQQTYTATADLWRPVAEMKVGLMVVVRLIAAASFVSLYALLVRPQSLLKGLTYGAIFGLGTGITIGYGNYSWMPIPYHLALSWFLSALSQACLAGLLTGWIVGSGSQDKVNA